MTDDPELAPQFVFRCAGWPLDCVEALNDLQLATLAQAAAEADETGASWYGDAYQTSLLQQRRALWSMTFEDRRFRRAMVLTNPEFAARLRGKRFQEKRDKPARHLDGALYRYLSRAVNRTEPADTWAGVGLGGWAARTKTSFGDARYSFSPDLRPFQLLLRSLGRLERYRDAGQYKLNGTIRINEGIHFLRRDAGGEVAPRRLDAHPALRVTLEVLAEQRPASRLHLTRALAEALELPADTAAGLVALCVESGLLVGGLDLPTRFSSPWRALAQSAGLLQAPDARAWWRAIVGLRRICRRLESTLDQLEPDAVAGHLNEAREAVRSLAGTLGLGDLDLGPCLLRCDMKLQHEISLGPEWRRRLTTIIEQATAFEHAQGLLATSGELHRDRFLGKRDVPLSDLPPVPPWGGLAWRPEWTSWEALWASTGRNPALAEAIRRWQERQDGAGESRPREVLPPPGLRPPLGAVVLRLAANREPFLSGFGPEAAMLFARFDGLLGGARAVRLDAPATELSRWFQRRLAGLQAESGLVLTEFVAPLEHRPNALTRPRLTGTVTAPWTVEDDELPLRAAVLNQTSSPAAPYLLVLGDGRPAAVLSLAAANFFSQDPLAEALLFTSFRSIPRWIFSLHNIAFARELSEPRLAPAVDLPSGAGLLRSRLVLAGQPLRDLLVCQPAARFARWQALARTWKLPPLLSARRDQEQPLLVARDSPLAVEVLFDAAAQRSTQIIVEALPDEGWLKNDAGQRYVCEIGVPFMWRANAWTALATGLDPDQRGADEPARRGSGLR